MMHTRLCYEELIVSSTTKIKIKRILLKNNIELYNIFLPSLK